MIWMLVALNTYQPIRTFTTEQECLFWRNSIMMQVSFRLADAKPPGLTCLQMGSDVIPRKGNVL